MSNDGELTHHAQSPSNWDWDSQDPLRPTVLAERDTRYWVIIYTDELGLPAQFDATPASKSGTHKAPAAKPKRALPAGWAVHEGGKS